VRFADGGKRRLVLVTPLAATALCATVNIELQKEIPIPIPFFLSLGKLPLY
jgi:hypothetical protein